MFNDSALAGWFNTVLPLVATIRVVMWSALCGPLDQWYPSLSG